MESDYTSADKDPFLTHEERKRIRKRQEELKDLREKRGRQLILNLNLADLSITEEVTFSSSYLVISFYG